VWALQDPALNAYVGSSGEHGVAWPYLGQLLRVERWRTKLRRGRPVGMRQVEVIYHITSATPRRAAAPTLQHGIREHWGVENGEHWVRDWAWDEDRCQVRSGAAPQVLAAARNGAMALLRSAGFAGVTAALRTLAARPLEAVRLVLASSLG
jgi:Transposase DDE domain